MIQTVKKKNIIAMFLAVVFMVLTIAPDGFGQRRRYRHHHGPSKTKHIAVGTAVGAVGGALIGGKKGALIGAGAGAGTGYVVYRHKKRHHRRHY
ncbi:MAG TPA: YMGG-like glycine zipper-containing protein [Blastocatellia bacterium]|nr:YMGG-like glycine zipper-containing protein [Blastocatellia bacterium]